MTSRPFSGVEARRQASGVVGGEHHPLHLGRGPQRPSGREVAQGDVPSLLRRESGGALQGDAALHVLAQGAQPPVGLDVDDGLARPHPVALVRLGEARHRPALRVGEGVAGDEARLRPETKLTAQPEQPRPGLLHPGGLLGLELGEPDLGEGRSRGCGLGRERQGEDGGHRRAREHATHGGSLGKGVGGHGQLAVRAPSWMETGSSFSFRLRVHMSSVAPPMSSGIAPALTTESPRVSPTLSCAAGSNSMAI